MIYTGDCRDVMKTFEPDSIDCVVTDPPYGLTSSKTSAGGFMGMKWDHGIPGVEFWEIALRVMKPGAFLLAFGGTRTFHRLTCAIEDAGFEIRDCIQWIFGSGFPKSHNLHGTWEGWGTALKPAYEPIMVCRKPLEGTVAENVLKWGTGAMNIDGSRIGTNGESLSIGSGKIGKNTYGEFNHDNPGQQHISGRWPANVILDEEAGEMLDGQTEGKIHSSGSTRSGGKAIQDGKGGLLGVGNHEGNGMRFGDTGGASRFFYCAKASKRERNAGLEGMPKSSAGAYGEFAGDGRGTQTEHQPAANTHPTVKPISLLQYLIKLVCPPNGIVLDPFLGSGSTAVAVQGLGFRFIGIEKEEKYCEIAKARLGLVAA